MFVRWSDGSTANPRTEENVQSDLEVTARFRSLGGVDIDWYADHGILPGAGETWADLDLRDEDGDSQATGTTTEWMFTPPAVDPGKPMMFRVSITPQE